MKKWIAAIVAVLCLMGLLAGLAAWSARTAKRMIEEGRHDIAGLALEIGGYEVNWGLGRLTLSDIRIYPAGQEKEERLLAHADRLVVRLAPLELLGKTLHAREIRLVRPEINYVLTGKSASNWDALNLEGQSDSDDDEDEDLDEDGERLSLLVDEVRIEDGAIDFDDRVKKHRLNLSRVDIEIDDIRPARRPGELPTSFKLSAEVGNTGGRISVEGRTDLFGDGINFDLAGSLGATPIGAFASFYAGSVPFPITAGSVAVSSRGTAKNNILTSSHQATISGLRVGGQKGPLINKYVLSRTGPIGVGASVNGDLSSGNISVSAALSKNLAEELMRLAAAGGAEKAADMAIEKLKAAAPSPARAVPSSSIKKGLEGLIKKR